MTTEKTGTKTRGFASMTSERQREIARKGGKAAHQCGKAHEFTTDEARAAGRKGGEAVSANRTHMSEIGRVGGKRSARKRASVISLERSPSHAGHEGRGEVSKNTEHGHEHINPEDTAPEHVQTHQIQN